MFQIKWLKTALANLEQAAAYIAKDKPSAARNFVKKTQEVTSLLADNPEMGRKGRVKGTRELIIPGIPYVIIYRVKGERVEIIRLFHTYRRWPSSN